MIGCNAALKSTEFTIHFLTGFPRFTEFQPQQKFRAELSLGGRAELSLGGRAELSLGGRASPRAQAGRRSRDHPKPGARSRPSDTWSTIQTIRNLERSRDHPIPGARSRPSNSVPTPYQLRINSVSSPYRSRCN